MTDGLRSKLEALRARAERLLSPTERLPSYDDVMISRLIGDLQTGVEDDQRRMLSKESAEVMQKLQEKPEMLRQLVVDPPQRQNQGLLAEELPQFMEQSAVPVLIFFFGSFCVAVLSRQFLRVVSAWRSESEDQKALRMRKIQKQRFTIFKEQLQKSVEDLGQGRLQEAAKGFDGLASFAQRWASEPTWEETIRAELAAFWERWGPQAYRLEANIADVQGVPGTAEEQAKWVVDRWFSSAKSVVKDFAMDAVKAWGEEASKAAAAARSASGSLGSGEAKGSARAEEDGKPSQKAPEAGIAPAAPRSGGLVIRIFGRWPEPEDWVNIANLPLAGDWREQALRLLLPSAKDVQDLPIIGPVSEQALTAVVSGQVVRAVKNSTWGALTTDLWRGSRISSSQKPFEIGYEVVKVESRDKEEMCALARTMPKSGTPGRVLRVNPDLESLIAEDA
ncbi:unnamed protein product [Effrenium voratum]|nr:unnamed protein product [Effrenium voratum]